MRGFFGRMHRTWLLLSAVGMCGCHVSHSAATEPDRETLLARLAQTEGTIVVPGLKQEVRVLRDRSGIPHIYAKNVPDLFFAQGFIQAQDRLFEIDLWRRSTQGRLAEILGPEYAERDRL